MQGQIILKDFVFFFFFMLIKYICVYFIQNYFSFQIGLEKVVNS